MDNLILPLHIRRVENGIVVTVVNDKRAPGSPVEERVFRAIYDVSNFVQNYLVDAEAGAYDVYADLGGEAKPMKDLEPPPVSDEADEAHPDGETPEVNSETATEPDGGTF